MWEELKRAATVQIIPSRTVICYVKDISCNVLYNISVQKVCVGGGGGGGGALPPVPTAYVMYKWVEPTKLNGAR